MLALSTLAIFLQDTPDPSLATQTVPAAQAPAGQQGMAIVEILHNSGPVAIGVLVLLGLLSLFSWTVIFSKLRAFSAARAKSARFIKAFRKSGRLSEIAAVAEQYRPSPLVSVFNEINDEYQRQTGGRGLPRNPVGLERAAATASSEALTLMEQRLTWLATIANIAPFIGLFGTVWGIIDAFHGLGTEGGATLRAVAPGISEALITTAAGILVAIPSVVGYNQLAAQLRDFGSRMDDFGRELLNAIENAAALQPSPPQASGLNERPANAPGPANPDPRRRVF
jgi:biopolymer transport protein TolQ